MATNRKAALVKRLEEIGGQLKSLQKEYAALAKKAKSTVKNAHQRSDENEMMRIRKKING